MGLRRFGEGSSGPSSIVKSPAASSSMVFGSASARHASSSALSGTGDPPENARMPNDAASGPRTIVAIRSRSATRASEVSIASSVPAPSSTTVTGDGAASRTRSSSPSP
ncbi:hypothetical protein [Microbacterium sp. Se63.02b]|uniref:hypothetical protein n=1 Tax=Microbacterium sp. Se63.02b TaxID=2709304 RepID=UPI001FCEDA6B|nr:hypothetical protein [Microbacterium sp. Se63.02b]